MSENIKKWYVLRAIGGKEKKVKEYIDNEVARLKLEEYVSQVLIPTEKVYQIRSDGKVYRVRDDEKSPFACVTFFSPDTFDDLSCV